MPDIPPAVQTLQRDLRDIFGGRVRSLVVYGLRSPTATPTHGHEPHGTGLRTLIQTVVIVEAIGHADLVACAARVASWHDAGLATPLLLAADEFARSLDVFPLEFAAIFADHAVVSGSNPFDGLTINPADVRRACEVQARSHLLHLREGYVETRGRGDALAVLIVQSAPAFSALLQSIVRLQGVAAPDPAAVGRHAERTLSIPGGTITDVVKLAEVAEIRSEEAQRIFPAYLDAVARLVSYVDGWSTT